MYVLHSGLLIIKARSGWRMKVWVT